MSLYTFNFSQRFGVTHWLALVLSLWGSLELATWIIPRTDAFVNFRNMAQKSVNAETSSLAIGSSRVFFGIDPQYMDGNHVNLASDYLDGRHMLKVFKNAVEHATGVSHLILEGGLAPIFYDTSQLAPMQVYDLGVTPEMNCDDPWDKVLCELDAWFVDRYHPLFRMRFDPESLSRRQKFRHSHSDAFGKVLAGFVPSQDQLIYPEMFAERELAKAAMLQDKVDLGTIRANRAAFIELVKLAIAREIKVYIVRFPVHGEARARFPSQWNETVRAFHEDILQMDNRLIQIHDFYAGLVEDERDFRDADHLNMFGAKVLSLELKRLL